MTSANVTQETTRTLEIVTAGPQGPRGVDGADGAAGANGDGQYPVSEFAFGDASPAIVLTLNPASAAEVALVQLEIEEAFDGAGASIAVGTVADPDGLMRADQNLPGEVAVFDEFVFDHRPDVGPPLGRAGRVERPPDPRVGGDMGVERADLGLEAVQPRLDLGLVLF